MHLPQYIIAAARLAFTAWREGRLSASPRRWLLDLRHLHSLMSSGQPVPFTATASGHSLDLDRPTIPPATGPDLALAVFLASGNRLRFDTPSAPKVSVLLVLFNRAELTFKCLRSLLESQAVSLEIVVVDNRSTDETSLLLDRLDGVRIVRSPENVGFLRASNAAAMMARGEHLLFLNSDAELLPGSLAAALATLEQTSSIGAVGARLVLPDGRLQEAGGIIWSDGSCQGYGRGRLALGS